MTESLKIFKRSEKSPNKLRKEGILPGVIYGQVLPEKSLAVWTSLKDFFQFYKNYESGLFDVMFEDHIFQGLLKEVQIDPLTHHFLHFDIYLPTLDKKIKTKVPLEFKGSSPAIKMGGVLSFNLFELEVIGLPSAIPEDIIIDVSSLKEIGQAIRVKDLILPEGIKVLLDENFPLVTVIEESSGQQTFSSSTEGNG